MPGLVRGRPGLSVTRHLSRSGQGLAVFLLMLTCK